MKRSLDSEMDMKSLTSPLASVERYNVNLLRFQLHFLSDWSLELSRQIVNKHNARDIVNTLKILNRTPATFKDPITGADFEELIQQNKTKRARC
jgi:hypothetical protein